MSGNNHFNVEYAIEALKLGLSVAEANNNGQPVYPQYPMMQPDPYNNQYPPPPPNSYNNQQYPPNPYNNQQYPPPPNRYSIQPSPPPTNIIYYPPQPTAVVFVQNNNRQLHCPICNTGTQTIPVKKPGGVTYLWCCGLFWLTGVLCCIPFCVDSCLDTQLICTRCNTAKQVVPAKCC